MFHLQLYGPIHNTYNTELETSQPTNKAYHRTLVSRAITYSRRGMPLKLYVRIKTFELQFKPKYIICIDCVFMGNNVCG